MMQRRGSRTAGSSATHSKPALRETSAPKRDYGNRQAEQPVSLRRLSGSPGKRKASAAETETLSSGHRKRRKKNAAGQDQDDSAAVITSEQRWEILKPPANRAKTEKQAFSGFGGEPEIWASSRSDLVAILRTLNKTVGGLSYLNFGILPTLVWLIDGGSWPEDIWDGGTTIDLSIVVNVLRDGSPPPRVKSEGAVQIPDKSGEPSQKNISSPPSCPSGPSSFVKLAYNKRLVTGLNYRPAFTGFAVRSACQPWVHNPRLGNNVPEGSEPPPIYQRPNTLNDSRQNLHFPQHHATPTRAPPIAHTSGTLLPNYRRSLAGSSLGPSRSESSKSTQGQAQPTTTSSHVKLEQSLPHDGRVGEITRTQPTLPTFTSKTLAKFVPEIATLLDYHENKMPIVVIVGNDASILPSGLWLEHAYSVLGFFDVISAKPEVLDMTSGNHGDFSGQVKWKVRLAYSMPSQGLNNNLKPPWWLNSEPDASVGTGSRVTTPSRSILVESLEGIPERSWWHCSVCGKLNLKLMLIHRRCSNCARVEPPAPTTSVEDARTANKSSPDSFPSDDPPQSMKVCRPKTWPDKMNVFSYRYDDAGSVIIKHIFTCNLNELRERATELFKRIQSDVELRWQAATCDSVVASGPYYSYLSHDLRQVPQCLTRARNLILKHARTYGEEVNILIERIAVIAWTSTGSKKGAYVSAIRHPVFVLCLGADADFCIERETSSEAAPNVVKATSSKGGGKVPKAQANKAAGAKRVEKESLRINMVHGDVLILRGDNFHYSLTRTGTTILIFGFMST